MNAANLAFETAKDEKALLDEQHRAMGSQYGRLQQDVNSFRSQAGDEIQSGAYEISSKSLNAGREGLAGLKSAGAMYAKSAKHSLDRTAAFANNTIQGTVGGMQTLASGTAYGAQNKLDEGANEFRGRAGLVSNFVSNPNGALEEMMQMSLAAPRTLGVLRDARGGKVYPTGQLHDSEFDSDADGVKKPFNGELEKAHALLKSISEARKIYMLCADYYTLMNNRLSIPTIVITAASGFVSFLGGSTGVPPEWKQWIAVLVGGMATVATILGGFQSTFKWGAKADTFAQAAQQFQILESKLNFCILAGDEHVLKDADDIQEVVIDISKGLRFFPPQNMVRLWWEQGLIDEMQKRESLPKWLKNWTKDLNDLGINEKSDLRFISEEMLNQLDPPMAFPTRKKCFKLKKDLGGILAKSEIDKYLVSRTQKIAKAASSAVSHQHTIPRTPTTPSNDQAE